MPERFRIIQDLFCMRVGVLTCVGKGPVQFIVRRHDVLDL